MCVYLSVRSVYFLCMVNAYECAGMCAPPPHTEVRTLGVFIYRPPLTALRQSGAESESHRFSQSGWLGSCSHDLPVSSPQLKLETGAGGLSSGFQIWVLMLVFLPPELSPEPFGLIIKRENRTQLLEEVLVLLVPDNTFDENRSWRITMKEHCRVASLGHIGQMAYALVNVSYRKMGTLIC